MADSVSVPIAEGGHASGGGSHTLLLLGGGAVVLAIFFLLIKQSSSTQTTAAGTSINAALGSIQEQNLNLMGQMQKSEMTLSSELGAVNQNVTTTGQTIQTQNAQLAGQLSTQMLGVSDFINMARNELAAFSYDQVGMLNNIYNEIAGVPGAVPQPPAPIGTVPATPTP